MRGLRIRGVKPSLPLYALTACTRTALHLTILLLYYYIGEDNNNKPVHRFQIVLFFIREVPGAEFSLDAGRPG